MSVFVAFSGSQSCSDHSIGLVQLNEEQLTELAKFEKGYSGSYYVSVEEEYDEDDEVIPHWSDSIKWLDFPYEGPVSGTIHFYTE